MTDPDFPDDLRSFIQDYIPTVDAAELLLALTREPARRYAVGAAIDAVRPTVLSEPVARRYLGHFESQGLLVSEGGEYRYSPATPALERAVRALMKVYNERPVTLVRMIYGPRDEKIRSFADAFRLKKE